METLQKLNLQAPDVFSKEEFREMMSIWRSPNGRYDRVHNPDGTITQYDNERGTEQLLKKYS